MAKGSGRLRERTSPAAVRRRTHRSRPVLPRAMGVDAAGQPHVGFGPDRPGMSQALFVLLRLAHRRPAPSPACFRCRGNYDEVRYGPVNRRIPVPVAATVADVIARRYTHNRIDHFMELAGIQGQLPPDLNKVDKTRAWLRLANENCSDPLAALGIALTEFMEVDSVGYGVEADLSEPRERVNRALASYGLTYLKGGLILGAGSTPVSRTIEEVIRKRDLAGLQTEFERIFKNVESDPASTVTASCALLESLFRHYIEERDLELPSEQSIKPLWKVVRKDLNFDPALIQDEDLKTILGGLAAIVEGTGSLRTHRGSAHGRGKTLYNLKPRHARLAAHAAFTLASFVLEAWGERDT